MSKILTALGNYLNIMNSYQRKISNDRESSLLFDFGFDQKNQLISLFVNESGLIELALN